MNLKKIFGVLINILILVVWGNAQATTTISFETNATALSKNKNPIHKIASHALLENASDSKIVVASSDKEKKSEKSKKSMKSHKSEKCEKSHKSEKCEKCEKSKKSHKCEKSKKSHKDD